MSPVYSDLKAVDPKIDRQASEAIFVVLDRVIVGRFSAVAESHSRQG